MAKEKITTQLIEKQIDDSLPRERKILCRKYLKTKEGQEALKEIKGSKEEPQETPWFNLVAFVSLLSWFGIGLYYLDQFKVEGAEWLKQIIMFSFASAYSQAIVITVFIVIIEFFFISSLMKDKKELLNEIKSKGSLIAKIAAVTSYKLIAVIKGIVTLTVLILCYILFLLPIKLVIPGLIIFELWIRNNPFALVAAVVAIIAFLAFNYWIYTLIVSIRKDENTKDPIEDELTESDRIIEALQSNPNIEIIDKEVKVK